MVALNECHLVQGWGVNCDVGREKKKEDVIVSAIVMMTTCEYAQFININ
jgi:hypothetical protein